MRETGEKQKNPFLVSSEISRMLSYHTNTHRGQWVRWDRIKAAVCSCCKCWTLCKAFQRFKHHNFYFLLCYIKDFLHWHWTWAVDIVCYRIRRCWITIIMEALRRNPFTTALRDLQSTSTSFNLQDEIDAGRNLKEHLVYSGNMLGLGFKLRSL